MLFIILARFLQAVSSNNAKDITSITSEFANNSITTSNSSGYGGAIYNGNGTITLITGTFTSNFIYSKDSSNPSTVQGGAIYNGTKGEITTIIGDFIGNYVKSDSGSVSGGAIMNRAGTITNITGDFTGNYLESSKDAYGAAIANYADNSGGNSAYFGLLAATKDVKISGNYIVSGTSYSSSGIHNYVAASSGTGVATIGFKALNGYKIVVNDTITGGTGYADYQVLEINNVSLADSYTSYSIVEINNSVSDQTINVYNGTLKLGYYAGGDVITDSYTTSSSVAKLIDSNLYVGIDSSSAELTVVANQTVVLEGSSITFGENSTFAIDISALTSFAIEDLYLIYLDEDSLLITSGLKNFSLVNSSNDILATAGVNDTLIYNDIEWIISIYDDGISLSTVVPEPSTYAMIFGALALSLAIYRKQRR